MIEKRHALQRQATQLTASAADARALAVKLGLDPVRVNYWLVDYDEMNELIAYDGFQARYPHWRWGMKYDRQKKQGRHGMGKAFEIVINDDPAHAFLLESNSVADQKSVITHVEAHADFFANNRWYRMFGERVDAAAMLENHARRIRGYMEDPDIGREAVERWIDSVLSITDTIDQHRAFVHDPIGDDDEPPGDDGSPIERLELSPDVEGAIFTDEWLEEFAATDPEEEPVRDVLAFLRRHGRQFNEETGKAEEMADWQQDVIDILRQEAYYFAPQQMTRVMNEGWAAYWQAVMMGDERFAGDTEFIDYADHLSKVLGSPGLNPYKLGKELWEYIENRTNRREVVEHLLRVDGITWRNFHDAVDFEAVHGALEPPAPLQSISEATLPRLRDLPPDLVDRDALDRAEDDEIDVARYPWKVLTFEGLARRHYSLVKPQNHGFLRRIDRSDLERIDRYLFDDARYASVDEALQDVSYPAGWEKLFEVRESHNDVTFIDEFLTEDFIHENAYFTYEYSHASGDFRVSSTDPEDVKKKLLLQFTNFGKPRIHVADGNYANRNELLLVHEYNGIQLDIDQACETLKRVFDLWGRPVNLKTIVKELEDRDREVARRRGREPDPEEVGKLLRYDGTDIEVEDLPWDEVADIAATDIDYGTKPDEWIA